MLGYEDHEIANSTESWELLMDPSQREGVQNKVDEYLAGDAQAYVAEFRMRHKSGEWVDILSRGQLAKRLDGEISVPQRLVGTHTDITARKHAEVQLQRSEQDQRALIEALPDIIMRVDKHGRFLFVSDNVQTASFMNASEFIGKRVSDIALPAVVTDQWSAAINKTLDTEALYETEFELEGPSGKKVFNWRLTPDFNNQGQVRSVLAVARDVTLLKEHQQRLTRIAHYDSLTGLPNRLLLADRMQQAMMLSARRNEKIAVIYIDLDGFKEINDRYGHDVGDRLLRQVAKRMKATLRDGETLARLGGDEFVAVLQGLKDLSDCEPLLERLLNASGREFQDEGRTLRVTASLGVTVYPQEKSLDADQLLRQADQAMYQAKVAGKNQFHLFDTAEDLAVRDLHQSLKRIEQGLMNDEFIVHYQPKVNMQTGEFVGAEALIRWQQADGSIVLPGDFLPDIEDHLLDLKVGERVLNKVFGQMVSWQKAGYKFPVSVNISAMQLQHPDFVANLTDMLNSYPQLVPQDLELEVLETTAIQDLDHVSSVLDECLNLGFKVSIDDFGTGYSSLNYLKKLSVNSLKIDRSFVRDMLDDPDDLAILRGVIGLASAFQRSVIAEGVESEAHGQMLLNLGCELAQGFIIARPMPATDLIDWIESWHAPDAWVTFRSKLEARTVLD